MKSTSDSEGALHGPTSYRGCAPCLAVKVDAHLLVAAGVGDDRYQLAPQFVVRHDLDELLVNHAFDASFDVIGKDHWLGWFPALGPFDDFDSF